MTIRPCPSRSLQISALQFWYEYPFLTLFGPSRDLWSVTSRHTTWPRINGWGLATFYDRQA